jgi:hypothetical protein
MLQRPFPRYIIIIPLLLIIINSEQFPQSSLKINPDSLFYQFVASRKHRLKPQDMASLSIKIPDLTEQNKPAEKCGFGLSAAVRANFNLFSLPQKKLIQKLTGRSILSASAESMVSPSGHFRIHYEVNGNDAPSYDPSLSIKENVMKIAVAFDSSYSFTSPTIS